MLKSLKNTARSVKTFISPTDRMRLLKQLPKNAICAEIGVWKGGFSQEILKTTSPKKLHLIDPWIFQSEFAERWYGGAIAKSQDDMDAIHDDVATKFKPFPQVIINRGTSADVFPQFDDHYFDWVYIDGNHYYEYVLEDLNHALKKVRPGGIIAGDDYTWGPEYDLPVTRAVHDFTVTNGLTQALRVIDTQFLIQI